MTGGVVDASASLALLLGEPGAGVVIARRDGAIMSAVNYSEVLMRTTDLCGSLEEAKRRVDRQDVEVIAFDKTHAAVAASLRSRTRSQGLSMADRCALGLALARGFPVLTADRRWTEVDLGVEVVLIR